MPVPGRKKTTLWNFATMNLRTVVGIANGIIIVPLYLKYIDSGLYGAWLATGNILVWVNLIDPGISDIVLQRVAYAYGKGDKKEVGRYISSSLFLSAIICILSFLTGFIISFFLEKIVKVSGHAELRLAFQIALIGTVLGLFANTFNNSNLGLQRTKQMGMITLIINIIGIITNVLLLISGYSLYAIAYSTLATGVINMVWAGLYLRMTLKQESIKLPFSFGDLSHLTGYFSYTFLGRISELLATNVDLVVLAKYAGSGSVTTLELSRRPLRILMGFANNITVSTLPTLSHLSGEGVSQKIKKSTDILLLIIIWTSLFIACGFLLFNESLIRVWIGEKYFIGKATNVLLCVVTFFVAVVYGLSNIAYSLGNIKRNSLLSAVKNCVLFVLLFILVPKFGIRGVLLSILIPNLLIGMPYFLLYISKNVGYSVGEFIKVFRNIIGPLLLLVFSVYIVLTRNMSFKVLPMLLLGLVYSILFAIILFLTSSEAKKMIIFGFKSIVGKRNRLLG